MTARSISVQYSEAVSSFIDLARTLSDEEWAMHVPCTPLWTVRDVLSHVAGIPDDALHGRPIDPSSDEWTAGQIERERDKSVGELLERWQEQQEFFGQAVEAMGERRPPYDCHSHEHDIRQAIDRPGNRDSSVIADAFERFSELMDDSVVPIAVDITLPDGTVQETGDRSSDRRVGLTTTKFEVFRSRLGRRSRDQVRAYDWSGSDTDIEAVIDHWFNFGPSELPITE